MTLLAAACGGADEPRTASVESGVATTAEVGAIAGSLVVTDSGTATYSIPIEVPPGRAGMQPALSLEYASGGGDGVLGVGWALGGQSAVTRCGKTFLHHGYRADVRLDETDSYCLDGQRLFAVAGTYGHDGTEYRKEHDDGTRVVSHGGDGFPQYFEAWTRDGRVREYGKGGGADLRIDASIVKTWFLNQVTDRSGNTIDYVYGRGRVAVEDSRADGWLAEPLLEQIKYTGHTSAPDGKPRREIDLVYEKRPDASMPFRLGYLTGNDNRIAFIRTLVEGELVREYRLEYSTDSATHRSRLVTVHECANAPSMKGDNSEPVCKPPTRFEWQVGPAERPDQPQQNIPFQHVSRSWDRTQTYAPGPASLGSLFLPVVAGDFNGDGIDDLLYGWDGYLRIRPGTGDDATTLTSEIVTSRTLETNIAVDGQYHVVQFDTDGRADLMFLSDTGTVRVLRSTGTDFIEIASPLDMPIRPGPEADAAGYMFDGPFHTLDLNGDGRTDIMTCGTTMPAHYSPGDYPRERTWCEATPGAPACTRWSDRESILMGTWRYWINGETELRDSGISTHCGSYTAPRFHGVVGDFDGDGLAELLDGLTSVPMGYNPVTDALEWEFSGDPGLIDLSRLWFKRAIDVNGDGIHDVIGQVRRDELGTGEYYARYQLLGTGSRIGDSVGASLASTHWLMRDEDDFLSRKLRSHLVPISYSSGCPYPFCYDPIFELVPDPGLPLDVNLDGRGDLRILAVDLDRLGGEADGAFWSWPVQPGYMLESDGFALDHWPSSTPMRTRIEALTTYHDPISAGRELVLDANGDGAPDLLQWTDLNEEAMPLLSPGFNLALNRLGKPEMITAITDGVGARTEIDYSPLSNPAVYQEATRNCSWPTRCVSESRHVVATVRYPEGTPGLFRTTRFRYVDGRVDVIGRGWLGFRARTVTDESTGMVTTYEYDNTTRDPATGVYPGALAPRLVTTVRRTAPTSPPSLQMAGTLEHTCRELRNLGGGTYRIEQTCHELSTFESMTPGGPDGAPFGGLQPVRRVAMTYEYDALGNLDLLVRDHLNGTALVERETLDLEVDNDLGTWLIGRERRRTHRHDRGGDYIENVVETDYVSGTHLVKERRINPGFAAAWRTHRYKYDLYGNPTEHTVFAEAGTRTTNIEYENDEFIFPARITDPLGHAAAYHYDRAYGLVSKVIDANAVVSTASHDGFGRIREVISPDGNQVELEYRPGSSLIGLEVTRLRDGVMLSQQKQDALGRVIQTAEPNPSGYAYRDYAYAPSGELTSASRPYFFGASPAAHTIWQYDGLGRLRSEIRPGSGRRVDLRYEPRRTYRKTPTGEWHRHTFDALGQLREVQEPSPGGRTKYGWYSAGRLASVTDAAGNQTVLEYDAFGRRVAITDPDRGRWETDYNGFDEAVAVRDGNGEETRTDFDALGRPKSIVDGAAGATEFAYDTATNGIGKVHYTRSPDGVKTTYAYDAMGRTTRVSQDDSSGPLELDIGYDGFGQIRRLKYPSRITSAPRVEIELQLDPRGDLIAIDRVGIGRLWKRVQTNADAQITQEGFGNAVSSIRGFDPISGRLGGIKASHPIHGVVQHWEYAYTANDDVRRRTDHVNGYDEDYSYDALQRLTQVKGAGGVTTFGYDAIGNMTYASDRGTLTYGTLGPSGLERPHAVTKVAGMVLDYDGNGSLREGLGRKLAYNGRHLPWKIVKGSETLELAYDAWGTRVRAKHADGRIVRYLDRLYTHSIGPAGEREQFVIDVGGRAVAEIIRDRDGASFTDEVRYLHTDHLGSTDTVTGGSGAVISRHAFQAFGGRASYPWTTAPGPGPLRLGFTGHEHDDEIGLINMRGRMYDPWLRRFVMADPFVSGVGGQALNRYSYVRNRPTSFTDPSGFTEHAMLEPQIVDRYQYQDAGRTWSCTDSGNDSLCVSAPGTASSSSPAGDGQSRSSRYADGQQTGSTPTPPAQSPRPATHFFGAGFAFTGTVSTPGSAWWGLVRTNDVREQQLLGMVSLQLEYSYDSSGRPVVIFEPETDMMIRSVPYLTVVTAAGGSARPRSDGSVSIPVMITIASALTSYSSAHGTQSGATTLTGTVGNGVVGGEASQSSETSSVEQGSGVTVDDHYSVRMIIRIPNRASGDSPSVVRERLPRGSTFQFRRPGMDPDLPNGTIALDRDVECYMGTSAENLGPCP